jgi:hypothetical protein
MKQREQVALVHHSWISYTLKMEAIRSSETSVNKISTRRHIPEDDILHSRRRENLKSYIVQHVVETWARDSTVLTKGFHVFVHPSDKRWVSRPPY